ncbi:ABC transporter substrate-binding protein [Lysinibacillus capsici]|uniref:ABC transporter substrate-binding protein n=1 Tax=Lysinibacillus TaxID=400634 RepID=UPI00214AFA42|nr:MULTISPECIES: ABC transporter substrate-binding protein [Lysinibacillus]UUV24688.1 ABC transporter substrate-binding protein [Lysinibacillus sp. FN11]UYB47559.1 ABC transporter substrate-binding protein [Lysinibacillus capsici]
MKKFYFLFFIVLLTTAVISGCSEKSSQATTGDQNSDEQQTLKATISAPKSPAIFPSILLAEQQKDIELITWETADTLLAQIQKKQAQFIALPLNMGANLYAKGMPLQLIQVNTFGSMFLVSTDDKVQKSEDLAHQTIFVPSQGGPPDILTNYLIAQNNIPGVKLSFVNLSEIGQQLASGAIQHVVIPEPLLSIVQANLQTDLHIAINFEEVWQKQFSKQLPQTGIFVNKAWASSNQHAIKQFQALSEQAITDLYQQPDVSLPLLSNFFKSNEKIMESALTNSSLHFQTAQQARNETEAYFKILLEIAPDSIGGALPNEDFYYNE